MKHLTTALAFVALPFVYLFCAVGLVLGLIFSAEARKQFFGH